MASARPVTTDLLCGRSYVERRRNCLHAGVGLFLVEQSKLAWISRRLVAPPSKERTARFACSAVSFTSSIGQSGMRFTFRDNHESTSRSHTTEKERRHERHTIATNGNHSLDCFLKCRGHWHFLATVVFRCVDASPRRVV